MTRDFKPAEMSLVRENLFPVHRPVLHDGQLSLSRHMKILERETRKHGVDVIMIGTASNGFTIRNEAIKYFKQACERANIKSLPPHKLRHTFGTRLGEGGARIEVISELLGHAKLETTKIYFHPS